MGRPRLASFLDDPGRFWDRVLITEGCWEFQGARSNSLGHRAVRHDGRTQGAHRVAWELAHGTPPPLDLFVCHHCDNPPCVRPDHLFLGTSQDNTLDAKAKGRLRHFVPPLREFCKQGHPLSGENLLLYRTNWGTVGRGCRQCRREAGRRWRLRKGGQ